MLKVITRLSEVKAVIYTIMKLHERHEASGVCHGLEAYQRQWVTSGLSVRLMHTLSLDLSAYTLSG